MKKLLTVLFVISVVIACNNEGNGEPDGDSIQPPQPHVDSIAVKDTTVKN